jgi:uncharacterized membrane protein YgdD (TMEM256/DUF423 family)
MVWIQNYPLYLPISHILYAYTGSKKFLRLSYSGDTRPALFIRKFISSMSKIFLTLGAVNAFLCVGLGAFGAHGLKQRLSVEMLAVYQTGVQYHFYHALGLVGVGLMLLHYPTSKPMRVSGWLMLAGIVLFSLSLYTLSLTGIRGLGAITPFGGVAFLSAWAMLAYGAWTAK